MQSAKPPIAPSFIYVDGTGNRLIDLGKGRPFKAIPVAPEILKLNESESAPVTVSYVDRAYMALDRCALYMAQSQAGRNALQILSDNEISFAYQKGLAHAIPGIIAPVGYDIQAKKITFDPAYGDDLLHLLFIQQAGRVDACKKLEIEDVTSFTLRSSVMAVRAVNAYALAGLALHVNQCLAAQEENPQRFVPPALEETITESLPILAMARRVPTQLTPLFFMQTMFGLYSGESLDIAIHDTLLLDRYRERIPRADMVGTPEAEAAFIDRYNNFLARDKIDHTYLVGRLFEGDPRQVRENGLDLDDPAYAQLILEPAVDKAFKLLLQAMSEDDPSIAFGKEKTGRDLREALVPGGSAVSREKLNQPRMN